MISSHKVKRPTRLPLGDLIEQARSHRQDPSSLDLTTPIDRSRFFVCPKMTPLYYTAAYRELTDDQARRYNQLTGLASNELISFFEDQIAAEVFPALIRTKGAPAELVEYLRFFDEEERRHAEMWRALNRLSEPEWYRDGSRRFIKIASVVRQTLLWSCKRATWFPLYLWLILLQEELAIEYARRLIRTEAGLIEPRYVEAYRMHLQDEIRHVQVDWYLIEHFYQPRNAALRWFNASLFRLVVREFFLSPTRMAIRVVKLLVEDFPELGPVVPRMIRQLRELASNRDYQEMLYSRRSHPVTFGLFDRFPEFHGMRKVFACYEPNTEQGSR